MSSRQRLTSCRLKTHTGEWKTVRHRWSQDYNDYRRRNKGEGKEGEPLKWNRKLVKKKVEKPREHMEGKDRLNIITKLRTKQQKEHMGLLNKCCKHLLLLHFSWNRCFWPGHAFSVVCQIFCEHCSSIRDGATVFVQIRGTFPTYNT